MGRPPRRAAAARAAVVVLGLTLAAAGCDGGGPDGGADGGPAATAAPTAPAATTAPAPSGDTTAGTLPAPGECAPGAPALRVEEIEAAVAAVEDELGGPQRYFEINATDVLVNLFVAGPDGTTVTPYAFARGGLTSDEAVEGVEGNTFTADALDVDPERVTSCVAAQLPTSTLEVFAVDAGPGGVLRYTIVTRSSAGGRLLVEVRGTGEVLGVEPVGG